MHKLKIYTEVKLKGYKKFKINYMLLVMWKLFFKLLLVYFLCWK